MSPNEKAVREAVDVIKQVAITLCWLASSAEYKTVGNIFGVGKSTVCVCIQNVCEAIVENFLQEYISFPSGENLKNAVQGYEVSL